MFQNLTNGPNTQSTAETPSTPAPTELAPEAVLEQLRTLQSQIENRITPLSKAQRTVSSRRAHRQSDPVIVASMAVIGSSDAVALAVGQPVDAVLQLQQDEGRWSLVAGELRKFLKGIEGANLLRREQLALIASQAYSVGTQLVRSPVNSDLVPHVEEIKRLKSISRRKKASQTPQTPAPSPSAPAPSTNVTTMKSQA